MNGKQYIATQRLSALDDTTLADVGDTCERVHDASLPWLLEQGLIAPLPQVESSPKRGRAAKADGD